MKIQRGIFQGDLFSPLVFVIAMMPLNYILRKCTGDNKFTKPQKETKHLFYIDDKKVFAKKKKKKKTKRTGHPDTNNKNYTAKI